MILTACFSWGPTLIKNSVCHYTALKTAMFLSYARSVAMATDVDVQVVRIGNTLQLTPSGKAWEILTFPAGLDVRVPAKLGFTSDGTTQYSGTILLVAGHNQYRVVVGVGNGRVTLQYAPEAS